MSALTITEYLLNADFGLDNFLFTSYIHFNQTMPGRMAFITACGFFIIGVILLRKSLQSGQTNLFYNRLLSSILLVIGLIPIIGYISGINYEYRFGQLTPMAPHAAVAFILFSLAMYANSWGCNFKKEEYRIITIPIITTLVLFLSTIAIWQQNIKIENALTISRVNQKAKAVISNIQLQIVASVKALNRLAKRIENSHNTSQKEWLLDANNYLADINELIAIEWIDMHYNIQITATSSFKNKQFNLFPSQTKLLDRQQANTKSITLSTFTNQINQNKELIVYIPFYHQNEINGFIAGVFDFNLMVEKALPAISHELFEINIKEGTENLYKNSPQIHADVNMKSVNFALFNKQLTILLMPKAEFFHKYNLLAPYVEFLIGTIFSLLIGIVIYYALMSAHRKVKLHEQNSCTYKNGTRAI